ncbi:MAG: polysaccharide deacetylase family protein [Clostridiaceae bacterium]
MKRVSRMKRMRKKKFSKIIMRVLIFFVSAIVISIYFHKKNSNAAIVSKPNQETYLRANTSGYSADNQSQRSSNDLEVHNMLISHNYENNKKKKAYLTFDDGPSTTITPQILDILKENKINATFFVIGSFIDKSQAARDILKREYNEGNSIGNHSYTHKYNILYPNGVVDTNAYMNEFEMTKKAISSVIGENNISKALRFPGGHMSWKGENEVDKLLEAQGYYYIDWNSMAGDAETKSRSRDSMFQIFNETKKNVARNGDLVVLMHDTYGKDETVKVLPEMIKELKDEGYEFDTIR